MTKLKILFLSANPLETARLRLDEEVRAIDEALRKAAYRDRFELETHWAVRIDDLQGLLLRHQPQIVHFSGHGSPNSEIILQDHNGQGVVVPPLALAMLFQLLKETIRCVVLNACDSANQAAAIAQQIDTVVGMSDAISDDASRQFAAAFYQGLAYGRTVQDAHGLGVVQIALHGLGEEQTPQLMGAADPASVRLVDPAAVAAEEARKEAMAGQTVTQMKTHVETQGGAYIAGNATIGSGGFVGRDKIIHGDKIAGDKIQGDKIEGDKVMNDKVSGDKITVGDISGGTGIAIGSGASATVNQPNPSHDPGALAAAFAPLLAAIQQAPAHVQPAASQKVTALQSEAAKGQEADDETLGDLLQDLVELVPSAVSAIGSIFAGPLLANLVGPTTKFVLKRMQRS